MKLSAAHKTFLGLFALLALFPGVANAATDAFTIYAYGSGNVMRQIFVGMKGFVDDSGYRMMIFTLLLITMIYVITKGFLFGRPSPMPFVGIILAGFGIQIFVFSDTATIDVHIEDQVHSEDYLVDDVPLIIAAGAALTSEMSRYMVKLVETFYMGSMPPQMMMSQNNTYNFGNKIMSGLRNINITEPYTKATFNSYMKECVVPEMYQGRIQINEVLNNKPEDFWQSIKANNLARMSACYQPCVGLGPNDACPATVCPNPYADTTAAATTVTAREWKEGMMVVCPDGHEALEGRITDVIGATAFNQLGNTMLRDTTLLDGVISSTVTHMTGVTGGTGTEHFVRAGMMNMFRESSANVISNGGAPGLIQVIGVEQAKAVQRTNWMVSAEVFAESVAYLWATLQAFIFAIFPVAIVLFIFPGLGPKAMAGYFGLLAWISLWMPFLAIINFLGVAWLVEDIRQLAMVPMSYGSLVPISEAGSNMQAITGFLGTMVPVLTYGMVRGGEFALTQIAQDASAPTAAAKGANDIAGKSYSYGSIAANNVGMNKFDSTTSMAMGYDAVSAKDGAGAVQMMTPQSGAAESMFGAAKTASSAAGKTGENSKNSAMNLQTGETFSLNETSTQAQARSAETALQKMDSASRQKSTLEQSSNELRDAQQNQMSAAVSYMNAVKQGASASLGTDTAAALRTTGAAAAGIITGLMMRETRGELNGYSDTAFAQRLADANGGSVAAGLQKLGVGGDAIKSEKDAREYLRNLNAQGQALQTASGGTMLPEDIGQKVTAMEMAKNLSSSELDKLTTPSGNGQAMLSKEDRGVIGNISDKISEASPDGVGKASSIAMGIGTTALSYVSQIPGFSQMVKTDGSMVQTGKSSSDVDVDASTGADMRSSDQSSVSRVMSYGQSYTEADQRVRAASVSLSSALKDVVTNSNVQATGRNKDGSITYQAGESSRIGTSGGFTMNDPIGNIDAQFGPDQPQDLKDVVERAKPKNAQAYLDQQAAKVGDARSSAEAGVAQMDQATQDAKKRTPDQPGFGSINLPNNGGAQIAAAQAREIGQVTDPDTARAAPKGQDVASDFRYVNSQMSDFTRQHSDFMKTAAPQLRALRGTGGSAEDTSRYGEAMTGDAAKMMKVRGALDAGAQATAETLAKISSGGSVEMALDQRFKGVDQVPYANEKNGGGVYGIGDRATGANFKMVASDGNNPAVVLPQERKDFGKFLQGSNASLVGVNSADFQKNEDGSKMSPEQAEAKYDKMVGKEAIDAADRKYGQ